MTPSRSPCTTSSASAALLHFQGQAVPAGPHARARRRSRLYTFDGRVTRAPTSTRRACPAARSTRPRWACTVRSWCIPATAGQAYDAASTAYDDEAVLVMSEIDPALNGSANPGAIRHAQVQPALHPAQRQGAPRHRPDRHHRWRQGAAALRQRGHPVPLDGRARRQPDGHRARRQPAGLRAALHRRDHRPRPDRGRDRGRTRHRPSPRRASRSTTPACCCTTATPAARAACTPPSRSRRTATPATRPDRSRTTWPIDGTTLTATADDSAPRRQQRERGGVLRRRGRRRRLGHRHVGRLRLAHRRRDRGQHPRGRHGDSTWSTSARRTPPATGGRSARCWSPARTPADPTTLSPLVTPRVSNGEHERDGVRDRGRLGLRQHQHHRS